MEMRKIKDFPYMITDEGQVFRLNKNGQIRKEPLKPSIVHGYYYVNLYKNSQQKGFAIHRLVAETFIPNPDNKPEVDHVDRNPLNNNVTNLRWVTKGENLQNRICNDVQKVLKQIIDKNGYEKTLEILQEILDK